MWHPDLDNGCSDGKQQSTSITRFTRFFIKLQSPRPDDIALASGWLHVVFTNCVC